MPIPLLIGPLFAEQCREAVKKVLGSVLSTASGSVRRRIHIWSAEKNIKLIASRLADARMVKTLWSFDQRVDLFEFYYPQQVRVSGNQITLRTLEDMRRIGQTSTRVVVSGRVGLGKSILARYLNSVELANGERIPVFTELRRLATAKPLFPQIKNALQLLNIDVDSDVLRHLLKEGKIALFLDGFDEVPPEHRQYVVSQIDKLSAKYPILSIVITSRPETEIFNLYGFDRVDLIHLSACDLKPLIFKLMPDESEAGRLTEELLNKRTNIIPLLETPLMVTLLVVSFRTASEVPAVVSDFYSRLFISLLNRHDTSKPGGFNRPRKCKLNDSQMQSLFNAFCILTLQASLTEMRFSKAVEAVKRASKACGTDSQLAEAFINDVNEITFLLLREGDYVRFSHKSIQEFHAAAFIADAPDVLAREFYGRVREPRNLVRFAQVIDFLETIDTRRFHTYLTIPDTDAFLAELRSNKQLGEKESNRDMRVRLLDKMRLVVKAGGGVEVSLPGMQFMASVWVIRKLRRRKEFSQVGTLVRSGNYTGFEALRELGEPVTGADSRRKKAEEEVLNALSEILSSLESRARQLERSLRIQSEASSIFLEI